MKRIRPLKHFLILSRIDAQGTASEPIIFTTAAIDDGNGNVDGLTIHDLNPGTEDYYFIKTGTQWTPGAVFLDADPKNNPLPPTKNFANTVAGDQPSFFIDDGSGNNLAFVEADQEHRSLWGGVIILGNSTTSIAEVDSSGRAIGTVKGDLAGNFLDHVFEGFIEGLNILEVGERGIYGRRSRRDLETVDPFAATFHYAKRSLSFDIKVRVSLRIDCSIRQSLFSFDKVCRTATQRSIRSRASLGLV